MKWTERRDPMEMVVSLSESSEIGILLVTGSHSRADSGCLHGYSALPENGTVLAVA